MFSVESRGQNDSRLSSSSPLGHEKSSWRDKETTHPPSPKTIARVMIFLTRIYILYLPMNKPPPPAPNKNVARRAPPPPNKPKKPAPIRPTEPVEEDPTANVIPPQ